MKRVEIKIIGTSRMVQCAKHGPAGGGYTLLTKCLNCKHCRGYSCVRDAYGLAVSGKVNCSYGEGGKRYEPKNTKTSGA